jgi:hypothetical protein
MKKTIFATALALTMIAGSSLANVPESVNRNILSTFNRSYENAQDVSWETNDHFTKAKFTLNGKVTFAYYRESGELIATTRNVQVSELPETLRLDLVKKYGSTRWLTELFEVVSEQENAYYASLTDGDKVIVYKADASGTWNEYSRKKVTE